VALSLALSTACSTARVVRLDTGQGEPLIHIPRTDEAGPVELGKEEFRRAIATEARRMRPSDNPERAARALFEVPPRSGWYRYSQREGVVPLDEPLTAAQWAEVAAQVTQDWTMAIYAAMWLAPEPSKAGTSQATILMARVTSSRQERPVPSSKEPLKRLSRMGIGSRLLEDASRPSR
jgi:hypothetical protein